MRGKMFELNPLEVKGKKANPGLVIQFEWNDVVEHPPNYTYVGEKMSINL